jgi:hypothetical protein
MNRKVTELRKLVSSHILENIVRRDTSTSRLDRPSRKQYLVDCHRYWQ